MILLDEEGSPGPGRGRLWALCLFATQCNAPAGDHSDGLINRLIEASHSQRKGKLSF